MVTSCLWVTVHLPREEEPPQPAPCRPSSGEGCSLIHQVLLPDLCGLGRPWGLGLVHRAVGAVLRSSLTLDPGWHAGCRQLVPSKLWATPSLTPPDSAQIIQDYFLLQLHMGKWELLNPEVVRLNPIAPPLRSFPANLNI